jgi:hypothetical protein
MNDTSHGTSDITANGAGEQACSPATAASSWIFGHVIEGRPTGPTG